MATREPRDPRFRNYRVAMYVLYILVAAVFSAFIITSVVRSVWRMSPPRLPPAEPTLTLRECVDAADALFRDLDRERQDLTRGTGAVAAQDPVWYQFRLEWLRRYRQSEAQCALDSHSREKVKAAFGRLEYLMDLYTTSAVQFDGQLGPAIDGLRQMLSQARQDPAAGRF
jgi:hypothetical protein